ncbi:MAG: flippase [Candidatus Omnitrophota bacterium]|jgi:PST family polysaccharide transporter
MPFITRPYDKIATPEEKKVVLGNFISLSTLQGINYVLPILVLPYLVRIIGPEKFGLIAFAQAFVQYFMILTDYGFNFTATRRISLCRENKQEACSIFSSVMTAKLILTFISLIIFLLILNFVPRFKNDWLIFFISFWAVIGNTLFPVWFFQGTEKMKYISAINIVGGIIYAACIFIFVRKSGDYLMVPTLNSLFFLITGLCAFYIAFSKFELSFVFHKYAHIREEFRTGWNVFSSIVAINAYTSSRVFAVGLLTNNMLTGYYSIAEKIAGLIQTFPLTSFSQAIYPRLNSIFQRSKPRAFKIMRKSQSIVVYVSLITLPFIYLASPAIVKTVCGYDFQEVVITLRLLLVSIIFVATNAFPVQFLLICDRTDIYSKIHIAGALIGLPLIFLLIKLISYPGAAFATIITEAVILVLTIIMLGELKEEKFKK